MSRSQHDDALMRGLESDPLLKPLRDALRPAPLDLALLGRIESQWKRHRGFRRMGWIAGASAALVAAALSFLFILPPTSLPIDDSSTPSTWAGNADEVLAAYAEGRWQGSTDSVIQQVLRKVDDLSLELGRQAESSLADDWDLPLPRAEDASPGSSGARPGPTSVVS